jgi:hypothetical protein
MTETLTQADMAETMNQTDMTEIINQTDMTVKEEDPNKLVMTHSNMSRIVVITTIGTVITTETMIADIFEEEDKIAEMSKLTLASNIPQ